MKLTTARLVLRPHTMEDAEAYFTWGGNPNVAARAGFAPHKTLADTRDWLQEFFVGKENNWIITRKSNGEPVGDIGLMPDRRRENVKSMAMGYSIAEKYWNRGYASEAIYAVVAHGFEKLGLDVLSAACYPDNPASRRVLEKNGLQYEGTLRHAETICTGEVKDLELFSILHPDYLEHYLRREA